MAIDYQALADELTAGHPDTGAYSANDATAASELNAPNRPANNQLGEMLKYLISKKHRTNQGVDTTYTPILGRIHHIARSNTGDDPFGRASGGYSGLDAQHIHACKSFIVLFESQHLSDLDFDDANLPYGFVEASGAWSTTHTSALKALSQNQRSRAEEIGLGHIDKEDVTIARAL